MIHACKYFSLSFPKKRKLTDPQLIHKKDMREKQLDNQAPKKITNDFGLVSNS